MTETHNFRAILWMVAAMALFAVEDLCIKLSAAQMPPGQIMMVLCTASALVFGSIALRRGERLVSRAVLSGPALLRTGFEGVSSASFTTALALIPLTAHSAIMQSAPLMLTAGAALFLGERVGWRRWLAILVGLVGVLMILGPGMQGLSLGVALSVLSVVAMVGRDLATRRVPREAGIFALMFWAVVAVVLVGAGLLFAQGQRPVWPQGAGWPLLAAAALTGMVGYYGVVTATRSGEASAVAPFRYSRMVFALVLGMLVLGERPGLWVLAGAALVIASGLYAFARARRKA